MISSEYMLILDQIFRMFFTKRIGRSIYIKTCTRAFQTPGQAFETLKETKARAGLWKARPYDFIITWSIPCTVHAVPIRHDTFQTTGSLPVLIDFCRSPGCLIFLLTITKKSLNPKIISSAFHNLETAIFRFNFQRLLLKLFNYTYMNIYWELNSKLKWI